MKRHKTTGTGKGSAYRAVDKDKFNENFERIFGGKQKDDSIQETKQGRADTEKDERGRGGV